MVQTYGIGWDFGNSHATAALYTSADSQPTLLTIPSATAPGSWQEYTSMQSGRGITMNPHDMLQKGDYVFSYNEQPERYIGRLAQRQSRVAGTGKGDTKRYGSHRSLELLLTCAGALILDEHFSLSVVTGMPIEPFRYEENREQVRKRLSGFHRFTLNGRSRSAEVRVSKVLMEGAGAALAYDFPKDATIGILDIGEFTTDAYATHGLEAITFKCRGEEMGMSNAAHRLSSLFQATYGRSLQTVEQVEILRTYLSSSRPKGYREYATPKGMADPLKLDAWVTQSLRELGGQVNDFISDLWRGTDGTGAVAGDFHKVRLVGGGAYYLAPYIKEVILPEKVVRSSDPEHDNARGYGWFAYQLLQRRKEASA